MAAAALLSAALITFAFAKGQIQIDFCDGTMISNPRQFSSFSSVGFRFEVPEGFKLDRFELLNCPTWGNQPNAGFTADIYKWQGSYSESVTGNPLAGCVVSGHQDNQSLEIVYDYIPAGQYLIHIHSFTDVIGTWEFMGLPDEYAGTWAYYEDGTENIDYLPGTRIIISEDLTPHEIVPPTGIPVSPSEEPEETAGPTAAPQRERITQEPAAVIDAGGNDGSTVVWLIAALAVAGATAAVILIIVRRDKKRLDQ